MNNYMPTNNMFKTNIEQDKSGCLCAWWNFNYIKRFIDLKNSKENKRQTHLKAGYLRPNFPQTDPGTEQGLTCK